MTSDERREGKNVSGVRVEQSPGKAEDDGSSIRALR
jgi:hypothetical protein